MNFKDLSIQEISEFMSIEEVSKIMKCERPIELMGKITIPIYQREFLGWGYKDNIIFELGKDEKSLILRKKEVPI